MEYMLYILYVFIYIYINKYCIKCFTGITLITTTTTIYCHVDTNLILRKRSQWFREVKRPA